MYMILRYPTGRRIDAVLLANSDTRLRLAVPFLNETIELRFQEGHWQSEKEGTVEIESIVWDGYTVVAPTLAPRVLAAGTSPC